MDHPTPPSPATLDESHRVLSMQSSEMICRSFHQAASLSGRLLCSALVPSAGKNVQDSVNLERCPLTLSQRTRPVKLGVGWDVGLNSERRQFRFHLHAHLPPQIAPLSLACRPCCSFVHCCHPVIQPTAVGSARHALGTGYALRRRLIPSLAPESTSFESFLVAKERSERPRRPSNCAPTIARDLTLR